MIEKENSYSKLTFRSFELSPLVFGIGSFKYSDNQNLCNKITPRRFNAQEKMNKEPQKNSFQLEYNSKDFKTHLLSNSNSIFNSKSNENIFDLKYAPRLDFNLSSSYLNSNKTFIKDNSEPTQKCTECPATVQSPLLKRKRIRMIKKFDKNNFKIKIPWNQSPRKVDESSIFTLAKVVPKQKNSRIKEKKKTPSHLKSKKNYSEINEGKPLFPKLKKNLKNYLGNLNNTESFFESAIGNQINRRNPNSIITIKRYCIKKVPQEFKEYVEKSFVDMQEINQIPEEISQFNLKTFSNQLISFNNFTVIELKNLKNTLAVLDDEFDSESEEELKELQEKYLDNFIKKESIPENKEEIGFCFGENPIEAYGILCKWYEEEMLKIEKAPKQMNINVETMNLCMKILTKIQDVSNKLSEMPYLRFKKKVIPSIPDNSKSRKRMKKPKVFLCEICNEHFKNGCALGGHMSRIHPNKSDSYKMKRQIRKRREKYRSALKKAKQIVLKMNGYNLNDLLQEGKSGKTLIKNVLRENKKEFLEIHKNIKNKDGLE